MSAHSTPSQGGIDLGELCASLTAQVHMAIVQRDEARERLAEAEALVDLLLLNVDCYYGFWSIRFGKADETTESVRARARAWLAKGGA